MGMIPNINQSHNRAFGYFVYTWQIKYYLAVPALHKKHMFLYIFETTLFLYIVLSLVTTVVLLVPPVVI